jgi:hypothetical protein
MERWNAGMMGVFSKHIIPFFQYSIIDGFPKSHNFSNFVILAPYQGTG